MTDKEQFSDKLETATSQIAKLTIDESPNVPLSNDAIVASVSGEVSSTTKTGGMKVIHQEKPLQTPCTQDLAIHDGQYTEGEHFQSMNDIHFSGSFEEGFSCVDLKKRKRFFMKQHAYRTEPPHDQTRMLLRSQDRRFSAEEGLAVIDSFELKKMSTDTEWEACHPSQ